MTDSGDGDHDNDDERSRTDDADVPPRLAGSGPDGARRLPLERLAEATLEYELDAGESVVDGVLEVVSTVQGCDPLAIPPLYEAVDPEMLEAIGRRLDRSSDARSVWCTFVLDRTLLTVSSDGGIYAAPLDEGTDSGAGESTEGE